MEKDIDFLYESQKQIYTLTGIAALLDWDMNTAMPKEAMHGRAEQLKIIHKLIHRQLTSGELRNVVARLEANRLGKTDRTILEELKKQIAIKCRIPGEFVEKLANTSVASQAAWKRARKANKFEGFAQKLSEMVKLKQQQARYFNPKVSPYEALVNQYEEGMKVETLRQVFAELKQALLPLIERISACQSHSGVDVDISKQEVRKRIFQFLKYMGITRGRFQLATSAHPFTTRISRNDVRFTTRYHHPMEAFFSAIHEGGHALYEMNLPTRYYNTVIYTPASYGLDESQALFWENYIGKSRLLWKGYFDEFRDTAMQQLQWEEFYRHINQVSPALIRVNADEVTYCLHIILRFELEEALINGKLSVRELRAAWNQKTEELLGIQPDSDTAGILQDIHWACGDFGYFPSYAIGMIYGAQLFAVARRSIMGFEKLVKQHQFGSIVDWLKHNVHNKGKTTTAEQIIRRLCKRGLHAQSFIDYLEEKYSGIYPAAFQSESFKPSPSL
jgi:carboxypeptidase Taq